MENIELYHVIQGTDESGEVIAGTLLNAQCRVSFAYADCQNVIPLLWFMHLTYTRLLSLAAFHFTWIRPTPFLTELMILLTYNFCVSSREECHSKWRLHSCVFPFPFSPAQTILTFELSSLGIWANILLTYLVLCESEPVFFQRTLALCRCSHDWLYKQGAKCTDVSLMCMHFGAETNTSVSVFIHTFLVNVRAAFQQHIGMCTGSLF